MKVKFVTKIFVSFICAIIFASAAHAQDKCNTYSEPSLGVTFCAPTNWTIVKKDGDSYAKIFGEKRNGLTPNINLNAGDSAESLSEVVDLSVEGVLETKGTNGLTRVEVKSRSEFAGVTKGFKVVYTSVVNGLNLRSIQYFFKGLGDTKMLFTATLPAADADALEPIVDAAFKTLKVTDKPAVKIRHE